jgi:exodeoxyribonuclease VII large subunit
MEVAVEGAPRLIKRNGRFQFIVENLHLVGEGALKKAYDFLKAKLEEEGLFARKRALPEFISSVGVITSRAGAVIHDFRNNLAKRGIRVYLKDVRVEGASSPGMVTNAIKWFNKQATPVDVLVLMRGGGSLEDLQGFNNEQVVRAVFGSHIPTIVSIGHDKDVPLAQLAADVMVSTPTAAAHAVASTWDNLVHAVPRMQGDLLYYADMQMQEARSIFALNVQSLFSWCGRIAQSYKVACDGLAVYIIRYMEWLNTQRQSIAGFAIRIAQMQENAQVYTLKRVDAVEAFLEQVNPERQLKLGYSIVKDGSGKLVRSIVDVGPGESLETQVVDGIIHSIVQ